MAGTVALTFEGVLKQENSDNPIPQGIALYHAFKTIFKVALISHQREDRVEHWLKVNGLRDHAYLLFPRVADPTDVPEMRVRQYLRLKQSGNAVDLVVDSDPAVIAAAMHAGYTSMLFAHPQFARPEFRPDYEEKVRPWASIAAEMEQQAILRQNDPRKDADTL